MSTMQAIGEVLSARGATEEEAATQAYVYELAHAWMAGRITLDGVRSACTGKKDRFTAMRFSAPGEDKDTLLLLLDALVAQDDRERGIVETDHGPVTSEILHIYQYTKMTQHDGTRAWTSPLHTMHGIPVYPDTTLPPGERKRMDAEAKERTYRAYLREKQEERR